MKGAATSEKGGISAVVGVDPVLKDGFGYVYEMYACLLRWIINKRTLMKVLSYAFISFFYQAFWGSSYTRVTQKGPIISASDYGRTVIWTGTLIRGFHCS